MTKSLPVFLILTLAIMSALSAAPKTGVAETVPPPTSQNIKNHPLYSTYKFDNTDKVVNIGTQPLYMPTGLITETMKRDLILKKALDERGVELRFYPFLKGHDVNIFLKSGDLDAGIGGDMPAISLSSEMDIIIAARMQSGFISIVANRHMLTNEFKGKRIAFPYGSNAHYALLNTLSSAGIDASQVDLLSMEVSEMPEALNKGKIDLFAAWEPTPTVAINQDNDNVLIHRSLSSGYFYFDRGFYNNSPDIMDLLLAAEIRALRWLKRDSQNLFQVSRWAIDAVNELLDRKVGLTPELVIDLALKDIIGSHFPPVITRKESSERGRIFHEFNFLKKLGLLPPSSKWARVRDSFDREILKKIIGQPETMRLDDFLYDMNEGKDE